MMPRRRRFRQVWPDTLWKSPPFTAKNARNSDLSSKRVGKRAVRVGKKAVQVGQKAVRSA